jgi:hypothetical protein
MQKRPFRRWTDFIPFSEPSQPPTAIRATCVQAANAAIACGRRKK